MTSGRSIISYTPESPTLRQAEAHHTETSLRSSPSLLQLACLLSLLPPLSALETQAQVQVRSSTVLRGLGTGFHTSHLQQSIVVDA